MGATATVESSIKLKRTNSKDSASRLTPWRLRLAQLLTRPLPPLVSGRALRVLYPKDRGIRDRYVFNVRAQTGSRFVGVTGDFHAHRFGAHGYSDWTLWAAALALCSPGDAIVEIGANVGTETIGYSDIVGRTGKVTAFEPLPENVEALERACSIAQNNNVMLIPNALADREGLAEFAVPARGASMGTGHLLGPDEASRRTVTYYGQDLATEVVTVEVRALDALMEQIPSPTLVVIDAEGAELAILRGGRRFMARHRPALIAEASPPHLARAGATIEALHSAIRDLDYEIWEITRLSLLPVRPPHLEPRATWNWLCLPVERRDQHRAVMRSLRGCALLPCIPGINPLSRGPQSRSGRGRRRVTVRPSHTTR
jgi:FkbM family methyltransferase